MSEYAFLIVALCVSLASSQRPLLTLGTLFYLMYKGIIPELNIPSDFTITTTEPWIFLIFGLAIFEIVNDKLQLFGNLIIYVLRPLASMAAIYTVLWFPNPLVNLGVAACFGIIVTLPVMRIYADIFVSTKLRAGDKSKHDLATGASLSRVRATNTVLFSTIVDLLTIFFVYYSFKSGISILIVQIICISAALQYQYVLTNRVTQEVLQQVMANQFHRSEQTHSTISPYQLAMQRIVAQEKKEEEARRSASTDAKPDTASTSAETPGAESDAPLGQIVVAFKPVLSSTETTNTACDNPDDNTNADEDDLVPAKDSSSINLPSLSNVQSDVQENELPTFNDNEIVPSSDNQLDAPVQDETKERESQTEMEQNAGSRFDINESTIDLSPHIQGHPVSNDSNKSTKKTKKDKQKKLLKRTLKKNKKRSTK